MQGACCPSHSACIRCHRHLTLQDHNSMLPRIKLDGALQRCDLAMTRHIKSCSASFSVEECIHACLLRHRGPGHPEAGARLTRDLVCILEVDHRISFTLSAHLLRLIGRGLHAGNAVIHLSIQASALCGNCHDHCQLCRIALSHLGVCCWEAALV